MFLYYVFFDTVHSLDIYSKDKKTTKLNHKLNPSLCQWIKSDFNRIAHRFTDNLSDLYHQLTSRILNMESMRKQLQKLVTNDLELEGSRKFVSARFTYVFPNSKQKFPRPSYRFYRL